MAEVAFVAGNRGAPGSVVRVSLQGTGLDAVTVAMIAGSDAEARLLGTSPSHVDLSVSVAVAAKPGARHLWLVLASGAAIGAGLFHVLPRPSHAGLDGIGSHLI